MTGGQAAARETSWHHFLYPLVALTRRDVQKRYAGSMLGVAWTILQPLTLILVYAVVFGVVLRADRTRSTSSFVVSLLCGLLPYLAINDGLQRCGFALKEDKMLLERETFPAQVIPAARVLTASVGELVGLAIVAGVVIASSRGSAWLMVLPVLIGLRMLLTLALAWMVSLMAVFISDLNEMLSLMLTVWLFLTPVFYTADAMPTALRWTLWVNPLHHVATAYRLVLLEGRGPGLALLWLAGDAAVLLIFGWWFFSKAIDRGKDLL
jgi:ABC-type polysaccharide/polyol phosphate export permease